MAEAMPCNMDCFRCIFADCINGNMCTPAESEMRRAAFYVSPAIREAERRFLHRFEFTPAEERSMAKAARGRSVWTSNKNRKPREQKEPKVKKEPRPKRTLEEQRERRRAYYEAHKEEIKAKKREYYKANKEAIAEKHRAYDEKKREKRLTQKRAENRHHLVSGENAERKPE